MILGWLVSGEKSARKSRVPLVAAWIYSPRSEALRRSPVNRDLRARLSLSLSPLSPLIHFS